VAEISDNNSQRRPANVIGNRRTQHTWYVPRQQQERVGFNGL